MGFLPVCVQLHRGLVGTEDNSGPKYGIQLAVREQWCLLTTQKTDFSDSPSNWPADNE